MHALPRVHSNYKRSKRARKNTHEIWILSLTFSLSFFFVFFASLSFSQFFFYWWLLFGEFVRSWVNEHRWNSCCRIVNSVLFSGIEKKKPMRWSEHNENSTINWKNSTDNNNYFNFLFLSCHHYTDIFFPLFSFLSSRSLLYVCIYRHRSREEAQPKEKRADHNFRWNNTKEWRNAVKIKFHTNINSEREYEWTTSKEWIGKTKCYRIRW